MILNKWRKACFFLCYAPIIGKRRVKEIMEELKQEAEERAEGREKKVQVIKKIFITHVSKTYYLIYSILLGVTLF